MKLKINLFSFLIIFVTFNSFSQLFAEDLVIDPKAETLINEFMKALAIADEKESVTKVMTLVHKSLLNAAGTDLTSDLRRFSYKKARDNSQFYAVPVKITRTRPSSVSAIGFKATAEKGKVVDYFVSKKEGVNGLPAPISVFFPENGGEPRISYMGSL